MYGTAARAAQNYSLPSLGQEIKTLGEAKTFSHHILQNSCFLSFFLLRNYDFTFFFVCLTSNRFQDVLVFCGNLSSDCLREAICQLGSQAPCPFLTWALSHAEESAPFSSEFFGKTVSTLLGRQVGFVTFVPVGKSSGPLQAAALLCQLA